MTSTRTARLVASVFVEDVDNVCAGDRADAEMAERGWMALLRRLSVAFNVDDFQKCECVGSA